MTMSNSALRRLSAAGIITIASFALVFYWSTSIVVTFRIPQSGATVRWKYPLGYQILSVQPGSPAAHAGLRRGDIALYTPLRDPCGGWFKCRVPLVFYNEGVPAYELGHPIRLVVTRHSKSFLTTLDPRPGNRPYPIISSLDLLTRLLVYTSFVVLGAWLVLLRPGLEVVPMFGEIRLAA